MVDTYLVWKGAKSGPDLDISSERQIDKDLIHCVKFAPLDAYDTI